MRFPFFIFLLLVTGSAAAQVHIYNFRLSRPDTALLYIGMPNTVAVYVPGHRAAQLDITIPGVSISYERISRDTVFLDIITAAPGIAVMEVTDRKTGKKLGHVGFSIISTPDWRIQPGTLNGFEATKVQLLSQPGLVYASRDTILRPHITVLSYEFAAFKGNEMYGMVQVSGSGFTEEIKNIIRSLPRNCRVLFENIKVTGPDSRVRTCNSIMMLVTE